MAGEKVEKTIRKDLNYPEMYRTIDNLWGLLFVTQILYSLDVFKYTRVNAVRRYEIGCYKKSCRAMVDE